MLVCISTFRDWFLSNLLGRWGPLSFTFWYQIGWPLPSFKVTVHGCAQPNSLGQALLTQLPAYVVYHTLSSHCHMLPFPTLPLAQPSCLQASQAVSAGVSKQLILCHRNSSSWLRMIGFHWGSTLLCSTFNKLSDNTKHDLYMQSQHMHWSHWNEQNQETCSSTKCTCLSFVVF